MKCSGEANPYSWKLVLFVVKEIPWVNRSVDL